MRIMWQNDNNVTKLQILLKSAIWVSNLCDLVLCFGSSANEFKNFMVLSKMNLFKISKIKLCTNVKM